MILHSAKFGRVFSLASVRGIVACAAGAASLFAMPHSALAQDSTAVIVESDRMMIDLLPPKLRVKPARAQQYGFYAWRVDIKSKEPVSMAFTADTAMRGNNIRDIVRGSSLRRCAEPKDFSSQRCRIPMPDSVVVRGEGIRIIIRDSSVVAMMWKERPLELWGATFEPNGQFRLDRLKVRFEDPDDQERIRYFFD